jgi:hypothetical protein
MLGAVIENQIGSNLNNTSVISMERSRSKLRNAKFAQQTPKPNNLRAYE